MSTCNCKNTDNWNEVEAAAKLVLGEPIVAAIEKYRGAPHSESQLIAVLHKVQAQYGYLSATHLDVVAQLLQVPAAKVAGVASFYHFFRLKPRGKFIINVLPRHRLLRERGRARRPADHRGAWHHLGRNQQGPRLHPRSAPAASAPAAWPPW